MNTRAPTHAGGIPPPRRAPGQRRGRLAGGVSSWWQRGDHFDAAARVLCRVGCKEAHRESVAAQIVTDDFLQARVLTQDPLDAKQGPAGLRRHLLQVDVSDVRPERFGLEINQIFACGDQAEPGVRLGEGLDEDAQRRVFDATTLSEVDRLNGLDTVEHE